MDSEFSCCLLILFLATFPTLILQGYGSFHKNQLNTDECGDIGLLTECCFDHCDETMVDYVGARIISDKARNLQIVAFVTFLVFTLLVVYTMFGTKDNDADNESDFGRVMYFLGIGSIFMYPVSGILCVVGCSFVAHSVNRPENSSLGSAFYCCLFAGIYVIIQMLGLLCVCFCYFYSGDSSSPGNAVAPTQESGRTVSVGRAGIVETQHVHLEQTETVVQPNGWIIIRSLRLTRVIEIFK